MRRKRPMITLGIRSGLMRTTTAKFRTSISGNSCLTASVKPTSACRTTRAKKSSQRNSTKTLRKIYPTALRSVISTRCRVIPIKESTSSARLFIRPGPLWAAKANSITSPLPTSLRNGIPWKATTDWTSWRIRPICPKPLPPRCSILTERNITTFT